MPTSDDDADLADIAARVAMIFHELQELREAISQLRTAVETCLATVQKIERRNWSRP